jgi:hypothetical protein
MPWIYAISPGQNELERDLTKGYIHSVLAVTEFILPKRTPSMFYTSEVSHAIHNVQSLAVLGHGH